MVEDKGVMVYGEVSEGKLAVITTELLGCGRRLADDLGQELSVVLVGSEVDDLAQEAITFGADKVYTVTDPLLKDYQPDFYVSILEKVVRQAVLQVLILGQTAVGRDLAPRLAFRLETAVSMDCVELAVNPESKMVLQTRPVYGGNAQAVFTGDSLPQIATVRAKAMQPLERDNSRKGEVVHVETDLDSSVVKTRVLEKVTDEVEGIKLEDAVTIVSGGRGIGSVEGFNQLKELAKVLNGAVGASRPPCDNDWITDSAQVGLTGKIVAPDLYIAVAISGSSQHMSGCSGSKNIVAINRDPEANIFKEARFGVIGDWKRILPVFTEKIKELMAG